jgi:hypothetical protein
MHLYRAVLSPIQSIANSQIILLFWDSWWVRPQHICFCMREWCKWQTHHPLASCCNTNHNNGWFAQPSHYIHRNIHGTTFAICPFTFKKQFDVTAEGFSSSTILSLSMSFEYVACYVPSWVVVVGSVWLVSEHQHHASSQVNIIGKSAH